jgi:hypothetical protein
MLPFKKCKVSGLVSQGLECRTLLASRTPPIVVEETRETKFMSEDYDVSMDKVDRVTIKFKFECSWS